MFILGKQTIVIDPCYQKDSENIINTKPGKWFSEIIISDEKSWGKRVAELIIYHQYETKHNYETYQLIEELFCVGVDSGQAGFFDYEKYPEEESEFEYDDKNSFYGKVCELTLSDSLFGEIDFGTVSSSGFGDGGYNCYTKYNKNNEVVFAKIVFISDEEDEEDYDEENDDE